MIPMGKMAGSPRGQEVLAAGAHSLSTADGDPRGTRRLIAWDRSVTPLPKWRPGHAISQG